MNPYTLFCFIVALSAASAGVIAPSSVLVQGPSRKTTLIGPEGSVISAVAPGGQIITDEHPGIVAHTAHHVAHQPQVIAVVIDEPAPILDAHAVAPVAPAVPFAQVAPLVHGVPSAAGIDGGQYVHGHAEALYDDGSYKPHFYH